MVCKIYQVIQLIVHSGDLFAQFDVRIPHEAHVVLDQADGDRQHVGQLKAVRAQLLLQRLVAIEDVLGLVGGWNHKLRPATNGSLNIWKDKEKKQPSRSARFDRRTAGG